MTTDRLPPAPPPRPRPDQRGPAAATVLVGALLVLIGISWLLDRAAWRCRGGRCCPRP
jgi:hypothetical protein